MKICGYVKESINEGDGLRSVIFFSGCPFQCNECHNPESQNEDFGIEFTGKIQDKIIKDIKDNPLLDGITLCGGEPFYKNWEEVLYFVIRLKKEIPDINIWSYTGYTFEQLLELDKRRLLEEVDVLIDGLFINQMKDLTLKFRGSSNQRIIDVELSLLNEDVILHDV